MKSSEAADRRRLRVTRRSVPARASKTRRRSWHFCRRRSKSSKRRRRRSAVRSAAAIILLFCAALVWAWWGTIDIVASATGKILPGGRIKVIQPFETGVVRVDQGAGRAGGQGRRRPDRTRSDRKRSRTRSFAQRPARRAAQHRALARGARRRRRSDGRFHAARRRRPGTDRDPAPALAQPGDRAPRQDCRAPAPAGAEGGRAGHHGGDDPQARDHHSGDPVARRHPQDAGGEGAGFEAQLFRGVAAAGRAAGGVQRPEEPSAGDRGGDRGDPRDARSGGGGISAYALRRTRQGRAEGQRARPGPDQGRAEDQASAV